MRVSNLIQNLRFQKISFNVAHPDFLYLPTMKTIVALVTGGFTGEAVISLKSADTIEKNLDAEKFKVYRIVINKTSWHYEDSKGIKHEVDRNNFTLTLDEKTIRFDIAFIALHGSPGEDGKLQGYFDMLHIPYTSCDALTSAITMNKGYTKAVVAGIDQLHVARSVQLLSDKKDNINLIHDSLKLPYFVKPNNGGSSIGMSKVKEEEELPDALKKAFKEDTQVLVEEFIKGKEYTVGIYTSKEGIQVLPVTEIVTTREFFDFEAKYTPGAAQEICPGRIGEEELNRLKQIAIAVYQKLNCKGVVRAEFILEDGSNDFYFIEINTVPGQTENSLVPQQVRAAGLTLGSFYTELIEVVLQ